MSKRTYYAWGEVGEDAHGFEQRVESEASARKMMNDQANGRTMVLYRMTTEAFAVAVINLADDAMTDRETTT